MKYIDLEKMMSSYVSGFLCCCRVLQQQSARSNHSLRSPHCGSPTMNSLFFILISLLGLLHASALLSQPRAHQSGIPMKCESIDPIEGIDSVNNPKTSRKSFKGFKNVLRETESATKSVSKARNPATTGDPITTTKTKVVKNRLVEFEAQVLKRLPYDVLMVFYRICDDMSVRATVIAAIVFTMLMFPTFLYMQSLGQSALPYLLLLPVVLLIPSVGVWLWNEGRAEIAIIDDFLQSYIENEKSFAKEQLRLDGARLMQIYASGEAEDAIWELAKLNIVSKIDPNLLTGEVLSTKAKLTDKRMRKAIRPTILHPNSVFKGNIVNFEEKDFKSDLSIKQVTEVIYEAIKAEGGSDEGALESLKALQASFSPLDDEKNDFEKESYVAAKLDRLNALITGSKEAASEGEKKKVDNAQRYD